MNDTATQTQPSATSRFAPLTWDALRSTCDELGEGMFMASVTSDGRPHVAWVMPGWQQHTLWVATFRSSQKVRNLRHDRNVALHWQQRPDAIVFGRATARLVDDPAESSALWDAGVLSYDPAAFFGTKDNPELQYVELTPSYVSLQSLDPTAVPLRWTRPDL